MKEYIHLCLMIMLGLRGFSQEKTIAAMKSELEKSSNPPLYAKNVLKKEIVIDTITIRSISHFQGRVDSLAYHGKVGIVYGPYDNNKVLVQLLAKSNARFNRIGQIFIDTSIFIHHFADSLSADIISRINTGQSTFEDMAQAYSMGGEAATNGDVGWMAQGSMVPQIEQELAKRKKGDLFRIWSKNGVHIIRKTEETKSDVGYVLLMRVLL